MVRRQPQSPEASVYVRREFVMPPFPPSSTVICVRDSCERDWHGRKQDLCQCRQGIQYTIDGCVWSHCFGWMVSITDELHDADDFERCHEHAEIVDELRDRIKNDPIVN
ncbi:MAG: hypothetical protein AAF539_08200 [Planctomycetota bacterium]